MQHRKILILDFGGRHTELLARRVRENQVFCEVRPHTMSCSEIRAFAPIGIILAGESGCSDLPDALKLERELFELGIPILGICRGFRLMLHALGGEFIPGPRVSPHGYGRTEAARFCDSVLFSGLPAQGLVFMGCGDGVSRLPDGFSVSAFTESCSVAAMEHPQKQWYGLQFHPEVVHTERGREILHTFLFRVCGASGGWTMENYSCEAIGRLRAQVGGGRVLLALSGGVDSAVTAELLRRAVGERLTCIFVDHGLMRKNEGDEIERVFSGKDLHFIRVSAQARFLSCLSGVTDPEEKRKRIGEEFIRVFEEESKKIGTVQFLAQGTIYPDVIESGGGGAAAIKSHHNVGGLPERLDFEEVIEPLRLLFKDEVRGLGRVLGLPESIVSRQPFPGPGLAVRVLGEVTRDRLEILRNADFIFRSELEAAGLASGIQQYFAVLTDLRTVGMAGGGRTYNYVLALRAVTTTDFMTADFAKIPYEVLEKASARISGEVPGIGRIVYDITPKPPATIEWE